MNFIERQAHAWQEIRRWAQEAEAMPLIPTQPGGSWDGPGSALAATEPVVAALPGMLRRLEVLTMLDIGCGDWNWMRHVNLTGIEYTGWDVDPGRIEKCRERVGHGDFVALDRPNTHFECTNILKVQELYRYDLVLMRDVLAHLPNREISDILWRLRASKSPWLLASTYPLLTSNDWEYRPSEYAWDGYMEHPVNLEIEPFSLRKVDRIVETLGPGGVLTNYHELGLFKIGDET